MTRAQPDEPQDRPWYPPPSAPSATPPAAAPSLPDDSYFGGARPRISPTSLPRRRTRLTQAYPPTTTRRRS